MSFTSQVKSELCKIELKKPCCLRAECYGAWLFSKCFTLKEGSYTTENPHVARRMLELAAAGAGASAQLTYAVSRRGPGPCRRQLQHSAGHVEIGRASCRERVCSSV